MDPNKFAAFNVLEDDELRQGESCIVIQDKALGAGMCAEDGWLTKDRREGVLRVADDTAAIC